MMNRKSTLAAIAPLMLTATALTAVFRSEAVSVPPAKALICRAGAPENRQITATAVEELQLHLERFFGMTTMVADDTSVQPEGAGLRFILGAGPDDAQPLNDGGSFAIAIRNGTVWLWGHDRQVNRSPGVWDPRNSKKGTLQATYQFLYEFGGVRWLLPGEDNTVRKDLAAPLDLPSTFDKIYTFRFSRVTMDMYGHGSGMGNHLWRNMGRLNVGVSHSFIHNWGPLLGFNRYFKEHPEYYALVKGERKAYPDGDRPKTKGAQVCTSNPAVADIFAKRIVEIYRRTGQEIIEVSPNDGQGFCECAACCALDRPELYTAEEVSDQGGRCLSDRIFSFLNTVARKVKAEEPNARLGMYLYSYYAAPPKSIDRIEDNIIGAFCVEPAYFNDRAYRKVTYERMREWMAKGLGGMQFFWYHGSYYWGQTLHVCPHAMAEFIKDIADMPGTLGVKTEANFDFGPNGLNYYVFFAMLNDPGRNVEEVINEFCTLAYGPGATRMKQFFSLAEDTFMARDSKVWKHYAEVARWYDDAFFAKAYALLGEAMASTAKADDPNFRKRIGLMLDALDHTRNVCDFVQSAAALRSYGLSFDLPHLDAAYKAPFIVRRSDLAMREALIDRTAQSYARMRALAARLDGTAFFEAGNMLTTGSVGNWGKTLEMLKELRGKKDLLLFNDAYPFQIDPENKGEELGWHTEKFEPQNWHRLRLDACWEKQGFSAPAPDGYNGVAWYRIPFTVPEKFKGAKVKLHLGAVDEACRIWVNGRKVGEFVYDPKNEPDGWNVPRVVDITEAIRFEDSSMAVVRVEDKSGNGGIWKGAFLLFE